MANFAPKQLVKAKMIPVNIPKGNSQPSTVYPGGMDVDALGQFLLNPSTWTEAKTSKWAKQNIPGLSDPHQQWISGGARTISFEALVTNDIPGGEIPKSRKGAKVTNPVGKTSVVNRIGGIASQVFNIPELTASQAFQAANGKDPNSKSLNLDISDKLAYYRSLCYPTAMNSSNRVLSTPNPVQLKVGKTFGNRTFGRAIFVVDTVTITITKQLADLTPIEARVTFTLTELVGRVLSSDSDILSDSDS